MGNENISKIESHDLDGLVFTVYYRITNKRGIQKAYNKFRDYIKKEMGIDFISGFDNRTFIETKFCHISIFKTERYFHITATMNRLAKDEFLNALKCFDAIDK